MQPPVSYPAFWQSPSEQKGYLFEQWVVKRLHSAGFILLEWRSDKKVDGIFPLSSTQPDLIVEMRKNIIKEFFAVECKWRNDIGETWKWTYKKKIIQYEQYSLKTRAKVFVAIGIGGVPNKPSKNYLIPLEAIEEKQYICQDFMNKYPWPASPDLYKHLQNN
jgi:hypothetical protein